MSIYDHRSIKAAQERLAASRREAERKAKRHKIGYCIGLALNIAGRLTVFAAAAHYLWGTL